MSEVKILRLTTGEEILCTAEKTDTGWTAKKASIIVPVGKGQIGLMGWMPYTKVYETGIELRDESVMFISEPQDELLTEYKEVFGSGLIVPKKEVSGSPLKLTT